MMKTVNIAGKTFELCTQVKDNTAIRTAFNRLAGDTFGLSFENWYQNGYWQDRYIPYTLMHQGDAVANVSVNKVDFLLGGGRINLIQIGTVMTRQAYRGMGLSRYLMDYVLQTWQGHAQGFFLFANDGVLDFYPRFGFQPMEEYQQKKIVSLDNRQPDAGVRKLAMDKQSDIRLLLAKYRQGNPFSRFCMVDNEGLLMFYCTQFLKDCVYYVEAVDTVVITEQTGNDLLCYDCFGGGEASIDALLQPFEKNGVHTVHFGFSLQDIKGICTIPLIQEDTHLFVCTKLAAILRGQQVMLPLLCHA